MKSIGIPSLLIIIAELLMAWQGGVCNRASLVLVFGTLEPEIKYAHLPKREKSVGGKFGHLPRRSLCISFTFDRICFYLETRMLFLIAIP